MLRMPAAGVPLSWLRSGPAISKVWLVLNMVSIDTCNQDGYGRFYHCAPVVRTSHAKTTKLKLVLGKILSTFGLAEDTPLTLECHS